MCLVCALETKGATSHELLRFFLRELPGGVFFRPLRSDATRRSFHSHCVEASYNLPAGGILVCPFVLHPGQVETVLTEQTCHTEGIVQTRREGPWLCGHRAGQSLLAATSLLSFTCARLLEPPECTEWSLDAATREQATAATTAVPSSVPSLFRTGHEVPHLSFHPVLGALPPPPLRRRGKWRGGHQMTWGPHTRLGHRSPSRRFCHPTHLCCTPAGHSKDPD